MTAQAMFEAGYDAGYKAAALDALCSVRDARPIPIWETDGEIYNNHENRAAHCAALNAWKAACAAVAQTCPR